MAGNGLYPALPPELLAQLMLAQQENIGPPPPPPQYVQPQMPPAPRPWERALEGAGAAVSSMPWFPSRDFGSGLGQGFVRGLAGSLAGRGVARGKMQERAAQRADEQNKLLERHYERKMDLWQDSLKQHRQRRDALEDEKRKAAEKRAAEEAEKRALGIPYERLNVDIQRALGPEFKGQVRLPLEWQRIYDVRVSPNKDKEPKPVKRPRLTPEGAANAAGNPLAARAAYWEGLKSETAVKPGGYFPEKTARAGMAADSALVYRNWQVAAEDYGRRIGLAATEEDLNEITEDMKRGADNLPPWVLERLKAQIRDTGRAIRAGGGE